MAETPNLFEVLSALNEENMGTNENVANNDSNNDGGLQQPFTVTYVEPDPIQPQRVSENQTHEAICECEACKQCANIYNKGFEEMGNLHVIAGLAKGWIYNGSEDIFHWTARHLSKGPETLAQGFAFYKYLICLMKQHGMEQEARYFQMMEQVLRDNAVTSLSNVKSICANIKESRQEVVESFRERQVARRRLRQVQADLQAENVQLHVKKATVERLEREEREANEIYQNSEAKWMDKRKKSQHWVEKRQSLGTGTSPIVKRVCKMQNANESSHPQDNPDMPSTSKQ